MLKNLIIILIFFHFFVSCSNPTENEDSILFVDIFEDGLRITNLSAKKIYYFAVEQEFAARINWVPFFKGPGLSHWESEIIYYKDIGGLELPIKTGIKVLIYYWNDSNEKNPEIAVHEVRLANLPIP